MKKFLLTIAFILGTIGIFAQEKKEKNIYLFKGDSFCYMYRNEAGKWTGWSEWEDSYTKIKFDFDKDVITIHASPSMKFKIKSVNQISDRYYLFRATDNSGEACDIRIREDKNGLVQLSVSYPYLRYVYNLILIDYPEK